ncbi:glycosyltransferase family 4 protein [Natronococcus wangiae]|uniref:glycosyltransferase family 4 protein n=1 Tax=Natronococcus wangiae TaxID=3068275 RepID=UPI00273DB3AF|nr:glycosyltransferase family 4 protein [Natronococcus sp. AD5]
MVVVEELDDENAAYGAIQNFIDVCEQMVESITIIGPESVEIDEEGVETVLVSRPSSRFPSAIGYLLYQLRLTKTLLQERNQIDLVFYHIGGSLLLAPMLVCTRSQLRSTVFITGSIEEGFYAQNGRGLVSKLVARCIRCAESITCTLADEVILLSESMDSPTIYWPFSTDSRAANFNYIDRDVFEKRTPIDDRPVDVVFVGRFEPIKGVQNLVYALPQIAERYPDIQIKLIGSGEQRAEFEQFVEHHGLEDHVTFTGWIDRNDIPKHLNDARTLLLPSVSEGVPKAILEAMACGTVPIATPVGGIPDLVVDGETGFVLRNSDPDAIERTVLRALRRDDLDIISDNAHQSIRDTYSYESVKNTYSDILHDTGQ